MFLLFVDFMFPNNTHPSHMEVCEAHEIKLFCKDYVERAEVMFILATVACLLVIISLVSIFSIMFVQCI
jgi:hypothetical protein